MAKCPKCGSENTECKDLGMYVASRAAAVACTVVARMVVHAINPSMGHAAGHATWHSMTEGTSLKHHCKNCGEDF